MPPMKRRQRLCLAQERHFMYRNDVDAGPTEEQWILAKNDKDNAATITRQRERLRMSSEDTLFNDTQAAINALMGK